MRLSYVLAATALLPASLAAYADTVTQTFVTTTMGVAAFSPTPFDPALGTLTSVSIADNGTFTTLEAGGVSVFVQDSGISANAFFNETSGGTYTVSASGSGSDAATLADFMYTNSLTVEVESAAFAQLTADDLNFTVVYTYTPAVAVSSTPEPSSLVLLGTGLLGALGAARRRFRNV